MKRFFLSLLKKIEFIILILIGLSFFAKYIPVGKISYLPLLSFAFPIGLLYLTVYLFINLFKIKQWRFKNWSILIFYVFQISNFFQISLASKDPNSFSVITYNIKSFNHNKTRDKNYKDIENFLKEENPDILCLQEVHWTDAHLLHKYFTTTKSSYSISSKFPIINQGVIKIENQKYVRNIFADIKINKDTIRVYSIHLESYKFRSENYNVINNLDDMIIDENTEGLKSGLKSTLKKLNYAYKAKSKQLLTLEKHIETCPFPILICGDFNDIPHSNSYYRLSKRMNDSFKTEGLGFGGTINTLSLPIRIDHILFDDSFKCINHTVFRKNMSDHHPVRADFTK